MRIALVAGETSGDLLGAGLIYKLKHSFPDAVFYGIGGPLMKQQGFQSIYEMDDISMIGLEGVFTKLPKIVSIRKQLLNRFVTDRPEVFVGIDVPDFNLGLEKRLTQNSITCLHYVGPTIWAWRANRIKIIKQAVAHMLVLFPFEKDIYQRHAVPATFVGHPIADEVDKVPDQFVCRESLAVSQEEKIIALLPGSRSSEIERHAELFLQTAVVLSRQQADLLFLISAVNQKAAEHINELVDEKFSHLNVKIITGEVRKVISASDLVLAASGTITLETALMGKPLVMAYKVSKLSEMMIKYFAKVEYYCMPNFLLKTPEIPEFVQDQATPENLSAALQDFLIDKNKCDDLVNKFKKISHELKADADSNAAKVVTSYLLDAR